MSKKYYWLKLKDDFFKSKEIKKLRRVAGGDTYTVIYLKLMLLSLKDEGKLYYDGVEDTFHEELALEIDEDQNNVQFTILYLKKVGLIEEITQSEMFLTRIPESVGSETDKAALMRKKRQREKIVGAENVPKLEPKTNAERQREYKAKKHCEQVQHVPLIEDHYNKIRYGGNYYTVFKRDNCQCAICGSTENLCVHHIDGFDEFKPENNRENKMVTLCRTCNRNVHEGNIEIPDDVLGSIGYFMELEESKCGNESNSVTGLLPPVTFCYTEKRDREKRKEIDIEREIETENAVPTGPAAPATRIPYEQIKNLYNKTCPSLPSCKVMSEARKKAIKARFHSGYTIDDFRIVFEKAEASSFLKGKNNRNWMANFDWLIKDANAAKVLDGNYDDHDNKQSHGKERLGDLDDLF